MNGGIDPGCVRLRMTVREGRVDSVEVGSERPQVGRMLCGRAADAAVRLVPLLFALCGRAQGRAAELALAAARGDEVAAHIDPAVAAEVMREHLWRWLLDLPPLLDQPPLKDEFAAAVGWLARDERQPIAALLDDGRIAALVRRLDALPDCGEVAPTFLPAIDAEASRKAWPRLDAAFCVQPTWLGGAAETGALARRGGAAGGVCAQRWQARLAELRDWAEGRTKVGAGGTASSTAVAPGAGRALVETARGLLMHEIVLDGDTVADYFIVAPTEWNFHPRGPLPRWLLGRDASDREALRSLVARCVAALDPCVRWELEWL
ncbi:MAG: nickel-dependent hydrogenase large subunit [Rhodocyclales bacterium]|nr:nickel-dependent hydrogenase large subunit [Rhodocyclales bacterium]